MRNTMNAIACYLTILLCLVATACQEHTAIDFDRVEALMDPHPNSALALLDTLHAEPQHYTAKDRARYYLLLTEAMDKCFLTHTTDTLIRFSAEYYEQHNDRHHYAKALYLQGRIYEDWRENDQSVACWVKALDYGKDSEDYNLLYRIASRIGIRYAYQDDVTHAMEYCQQALRYAIAANDSSCISYAHSYLARVHSLNNEWTVATKEYEMAIAIALAAPHASSALRLATKECINIYTKQHDYDKADSLISVMQADSNMVKNGPYYLVIGDYYRYVNDSAKAIPYLLEAMRLGNFYTKCSAGQALSYLYEQYGMKKEQKAYERLIKQYTDSIKSKEAGTVFASASIYQQEKTEHLFIQMARRIAALLLVLSLLFLVAWQRRKRAQDTFAAEQERQIKSLLLQLHDLEAEKERIEREQSRKQSEQLVAKNQELEREKETIVRKKEEYQRKLISIQSELERLLQPSQTLLGQMRDPKQRRPLTEAQWKEFFVLVDYSQSNFYTNLTIEYPDLKKSDLELCCLIRMGIQKNEEIAALCNINALSVKKRKHRLKERMHIVDSCGNSGDLEAFICSLWKHVYP